MAPKESERQPMDHLSSTNIARILPADGFQGALVGRIWRPGTGPCVVAVREDGLFDISSTCSTVSGLAAMDDPARVVKAAQGEWVGSLEEIAGNTAPDSRDASKPWLLAPIDLQVDQGGRRHLRRLHAGARHRGAGAGRCQRRDRHPRRGHPARRATTCSRLKPGSPEAMALKEVLVAQGAWSQYLEVGIGPDAEIFTKAPTLSAVGTFMDAGLHPEFDLEQPGAGGGARRRARRHDRRRHARQRREPARRRRPLGAAARRRRRTTTPPAADRPVHPLLRRRLLPRRRAADDRDADRRGRGRFQLEGSSSHHEDQPRPGGPRGADHRPAPSVSGRVRPLPRHHVRADAGSRRAGHGLHAQGRRHRHDRRAEARRAGQPHEPTLRMRAVDLRASARSCATWPSAASSTTRAGHDLT